MNTRHSAVLLRFSLLLLVVFAQGSFAQGRGESTFLPEGIEATGDTAEVRALYEWAGEHELTESEQAEQVAQRAQALARELDDQKIHPEDHRRDLLGTPLCRRDTLTQILTNARLQVPPRGHKL